jgi:hypothetical protein
MIKNTRVLLIILFSLLLVFSCKKPDDTLLTGDIKLTELSDKTNYEAPLVLENDVNVEVFINNNAIIFDRGIYELSDAGFYTMKIGGRKAISFVLLDPERGETEWGLKKWVPKPVVVTQNFNGKVNIVYPKQYVTGVPVPVLLKIDDYEMRQMLNLEATTDKGNSFFIKNGTGTTLLNIETSQSAVFTIAGKNYSIDLAPATSRFDLEQNILELVEVPANSLVELKDDLTIQQGGGIVFNEGVVLIIAKGVNIYNEGLVTFAGRENNPIMVSSNNSKSLFGGFISEGENASINASYTFFSSFAHHSGAGYQYGHAKHQALFKASHTKLYFTNCVFTDSPGQVFYPENCVLQIDSCIVQRVKTGGQVNLSQLSITGSYFSDFPDDSQTFQDNDNDALYINASDANIDDSYFMYAKDDGIDSGGGEGGTINIRNCIIEACFHEGFAFSSTEPAVKHHRIYNTIVRNCQQGIELGFSSSKHDVVVENCTFANNYIGVRYGDNYDWSISGSITLSNPIFENNYCDTWNMVRQIWAPKPDNMTVNYN